MEARRLRVNLVTNVLAHYRTPCFEALAQLVDLRLFVLSEGMAHRRYVDGEVGTLSPELLSGWSWENPPFDHVHLSDPRPVLASEADLWILSGWAEPSYLILWMLAQLKRIPFLFWIESTRTDFERSPVKEGLKRVILSRARGCLVPGRAAGEYCADLGVSPAKIFTAPNATDREFFSGLADELVPQRDALRAELELESLTVLFVGRLFEELKSFSTLLKAAQRCESAVTVLVAGDGPDRASYERQADALGVDVRFKGILDHRQLARLYAAADAFCLPSRNEPWGFVLNEAMEFGLPILASSHVGSHPDLVDVDNGRIHAVGDAHELAVQIDELAGDSDLRLSMGRASQARIRHYSPDAWARGVHQAVQSTVGG